MITQSTRAFTFEATNDEYHARPEVSNSQLGTFLDDPALFHAYHVAKTWTKPPATPAMQFGTNIHEVLPPGSLDSLVVRVPREVLNEQGHRRGKAWTDFAAANEGKILATDDEMEPYECIVSAAKNHPKAIKLLESPHVEFNIAWTDEETGIPCRVRLDRYTPGLAISDIKTTIASTKKDFATDAWNLGYHRQMAFYQEGLYQLTGERLQFVFIACRKSRPYTVSCYELDQEFCTAGHREWRKALKGIARCRDSGKWEREEAGTIQELSPPNWTKYEGQWE